MWLKRKLYEDSSELFWCQNSPFNRLNTLTKSEGQPVIISFETPRGNTIDFDSSLNKYHITGVCDSDADEYGNDIHDNDSNE